MQLQPVPETSAEEAAKLLTFIDTQNIDELDPSLQDGHHISQERDLPMRVATKGMESTHSSNEIMHLKVLVLGDEQEPGNVRFEITSMDDIFFHYVGNVNEEVFMTIKADQQITADYTEFYSIVVKMLDQIQKGDVAAELILDNYNETATLNFQQESEFRSVELLSLNLQESDVEMIKNAISFRINA